MLLSLFGDCHRPYHKELHEVLDPELAYYPLSEQQHIIIALENKDEKALSAIKKISQPELILLRYSDNKETIFYSQLLRNTANHQREPLTDIIISNLNK